MQILSKPCWVNREAAGKDQSLIFSGQDKNIEKLKISNE